MTRPLQSCASTDVGLPVPAGRNYSREPATIWAVLHETASRRPDAEAFVMVDIDGATHRVQFRHLIGCSNRLATGFLRHGICRGDRIALWMTNQPEWLYTYFALLSIGAIVVPINTWLKDEEVRYTLRQSGSRHLILLDRFRKLDFCAVLQRLCPEWTESEPGTIFSDSLPDLRGVFVFAREAFPESAVGHAFDLRVLLATPADDVTLGKARSRVRPHDPAVIKYTSGSTGYPKGAVLEQWGIVANGVRHGRRLHIAPEDRWFSAKPFFHAGGSIWGLMTMVATGCTLVSTEAFDPELSLELIERERCTVNFASNTMLRDELKVLDRRRFDLSSVRILYALEASDVERAKERMGFEMVFVPWGLTEAYGVVTLVGPEDSPEAQWTTHGRPLDDMTVRIVKPGTWDDLPPGEKGEIVIGGTLMRGYFEKPAETAEILRDGWLRTGDSGWLDQRGYLHYVGRIKAMLKVGGENVAVEEVEDCVRRCDGVKECVVVGVPDERKIEVPRAYVVADPRVSEEMLRAWCTGRLASFKIPRDFVFVAEFPLTGSSKIAKTEVVSWAARGAVPEAYRVVPARGQPA